MAEGILTATLNGTAVTVLGDSEISTLFVTSRPFDGGTQNNKRWQAIEIEVSDPSALDQLKIELRHGKTVKEIQSATWTTYDASGSDAAIPLRKSSILIQFRIKDTSPTARWKLTRVTLFGQPMRGRRL